MRRTVLAAMLALTVVLAYAGDAYAQRRGGGWRGGGGYYDRGYYPYYYGGYGYDYAPGYSAAMPGYQPVADASALSTQSNYYSPGTSQQARMTVRVPAQDAQVWVADMPTKQQGMERQFYSPPLQPGQTYSYTIKARWMDGGRPIEGERQVNIQAGQAVTVDFRGSSPGENLPPPNPTPANPPPPK